MSSPVGVQESASGSAEVLFVSFNQDHSCLHVGTKSGFTLYDLTTIEGLDTMYDNEGETKDVYIIERLYSSSLVAIVSMSAPRTLKVCYFKKGTEICTKSYFNQILAVRINRQRLVVLLEDCMYIYSSKDMSLMHTIRDTPLNPKGLCAISTNNETAYLAYPGSALTGEVQVFDITNYKAVVNISAHNGPLAQFVFDLMGTKLATASVKGTVIRVFSIPDGQPLFDLRRGLKRCVEISCLAFSRESTFLCVSSNTETIHIFKLVDASEKEMATADDNGSWMGYFNKVVSVSASYLPTQVSSVLNQDRAFATAKLPILGVKSICAIVSIQKVPYIFAACYDGYVYIFNIDSKAGGVCDMVRQHCVMPGMDAPGKDDISSGEMTSQVVNLPEADRTKEEVHAVAFQNTERHEEYKSEADAS